MKLEKEKQIKRRLINLVGLGSQPHTGEQSREEIDKTYEWLQEYLVQEIQTAVQKERKRILKEFVLAECEIPGEGKYGRAEFYHLSKTKYNELKDKS